MPHTEYPLPAHKLVVSEAWCLHTWASAVSPKGSACSRGASAGIAFSTLPLTVRKTSSAAAGGRAARWWSSIAHSGLQGAAEYCLTQRCCPECDCIHRQQQVRKTRWGWTMPRHKPRLGQVCE